MDPFERDRSSTNSALLEPQRDVGLGSINAAKRFLPPGWCALLCKIKNQDICNDPWVVGKQSLAVIHSNSTSCKDMEPTLQSRPDTLPNIEKCVEVKQSPFHGKVVWTQHLRPILPRSRPNLWRRTTECLAERNQLPY